MALYLGIETVSCQLLQLDAMMDVELKLEKVGQPFCNFFIVCSEKLLRSIVLPDEICFFITLHE